MARIEQSIIVNVPLKTAYNQWAHNEGEVFFRRIDDEHCEVLLTLEYQPHGVIEAAGDLLGFVRRRVEGDLKRFKGFIESRGRETGGWRGDIEFGQVHRP
jgi:hypothetical protein